LKYNATPLDGAWLLATASTIAFQVAYALDATDTIEVQYARD
jgi:hypothetical protein